MKNNLLLRFISTVILVPVVLGVVWVGGFAYDLLIVVAMLGAFSEWVRMVAPQARGRVMLMGYSGLTALLFSVSVWGIGVAFLLSLVVWLAVLLSAARKSDSNKALHRSRALWLSYGIPYLAWSGIALIHLRADALLGFELIAYLLFVVWGTDIGAYFAGKTIGGPKLWPQISPNKTWAGLVGGMIVAAFMGFFVVDSFESDYLVLGAGLGAVLAVISQVGDFFESYVKRKNGVKDSGNLIPGHGGILDRVDGLLFAAVFLALFNMIGR